MIILRLTFIAILFLSSINAKIYPYGEKPNWEQLEMWQKTITKKRFTYLLKKIYFSKNAKNKDFTIFEDKVEIKKNDYEKITIFFAKDEAEAKKNYLATKKHWQGANKLKKSTLKNFLKDYRIAIDPGHIGGSFAKLEERWFKFGEDKAIMEGNMTLLVAKILKKKLEHYGAKVFLTRNNYQSLAKISFLDFVEEIRKKFPVIKNEDKIRDLAAKAYIRSVEIRERSKIIEKIKPDLALCLHFNAEAWGENPTQAEMVKQNSIHFLINGCYSDGEISYDDQRFELSWRLFNQFFYTEYAITQSISQAFSLVNPMPTYTYRGNNARIIGSNPQIWARNLLANRIFNCPVIFLEPYIMNSLEDYARMQAGLYKGKKFVYDRLRKSIFIEYADAILHGLLVHFKEFRDL